MGQILHGNATTTYKVRKEIQESNETNESLAARYNINIKTVRKWKARSSVEDQQCGKKKGQGSVLSSLEEEIICEVRKQLLLPLDDMYTLLKPEIPSLSRSNLHRCLQRNGVSRLKDLLPKDEKPKRKAFKDYAPGYLHIDTTEVRIAKERFYLFVAVDRCTKFAHIKVTDNKRQETAAAFLKQVLAVCPFKVTKILTDNGGEYTSQHLAKTKKLKKIHAFSQICQENSIEHRLTPIYSPWTNGQVEVMNRKIKQHTTKTFHYESVEEFKEHLGYYLLKYNFDSKLRALNFQTPFQRMKIEFENNPENFNQNPDYLNTGPIS